MFKKEKEKSHKLIYDGSFLEKNFLSPYYINTTNHKYIEINNQFYSTLLIVNYAKVQTELILKNLIETNLNLNISMFYEKQNPYQIIQELTYHIGNIGVQIKQTNENRQDIDLANSTYGDAKYIRKEMQIEKEDFYYLYIYLNIYATDAKELEYTIGKIESICEGIGIFTRRAYFREEQGFISCLPLMSNHTDIKETTKRNILTNGLVSTYPFLSSSIFDEKGIFFGINQYSDALIFIDKFNQEKYQNSNMCIFGTSGARKITFYKTNDFQI